MFQGADDLLAYIADEGVENVDVRFCDLPGIMQHFTVPAGSFGPEVFEEGLAFDGSSVAGSASEAIRRSLRVRKTWLGRSAQAMS